MAKKVILKDLNDIEVLPITRGELVLDSSGNLALHSTLFLATYSLPGLMSSEDKYKLDHLENSSPGANNKVAQVNTTTNDVYRLLFSETADDTDRTEGSRKSANLTFNPSTGVLNLTGAIKANGGTLNGTLTITSSVLGEQLIIKRNDGSNLPAITFQNTANGIVGYLGVTGSNSDYPYSPVFVDSDKIPYKIYHGGNFNPSDYLLKSGGVLSGDLYFGNTSTTSNSAGTRTRLPSHIYRNVYDTSGNVYDHYYNGEYTASTYTFANLRVKNDSRYKILRFGGDGTFTWDGNTVIHSGNIGSQSVGNASTADKLKNTVKIWGLDFDGSKNISGALSLGNGHIDRNDESGTARTLISFTEDGTYFNYGLTSQGYKTYIEGNEIIFRYGTGHARGMTILSSGNVGIGTANPAYKLDVNGAIGVYESLNFTDENANYITVPTTGKLAFNIGASGSANTKMCMLNNGNVGIGTTDPKYKLHVSGIIKGTTIFSTNSFLNPGGNGIFLTGGGIFYHDANDAWVSDLITFKSNSVKLYQNTACSGTLSVTGTGTFNDQIISKVADGTAPLTVISTTKVTNLHADRLDGYHASGLFTNLSNSDNNISITIGGTTKTLTPAYASNANTVDGYHMGSFGHYKYSKTVTDTTNAVWYIKVVFNTTWNSEKHYIHFNPNYNNIQGRLFLSLSSYDTYGYLALVSSYNDCNIKGFYIYRDYSAGKLTMYLKLAAYTSATCIMYSTLEISSATVVSAPSISFTDISTANRIYTDMKIVGGGFIKRNSDDSYVLLGGGGHKALSDFAMSSAYVKKSGDIMTGKLTMTGGGIIITTNTDSNYRASVEFYKGIAANTTYTYDAQIGWHNTGGDGTGSICILPYATSKKPWERGVGLWLSKDQLLFEGDTVLHSGNSSVSGGGSSVGSSITVNIGGISKTLTIPSNASTASKVYINNSSNNSVFPVIFTNREPCGTPRNDNLFVDTEPGTGYNPSTNAFVASAMTAGVHNSTSTLYLDSGSATTSIIFRIGGTEKVRIALPNGNVGIGTTSPNLKLHVIGSVAATSSIIGGYTNTRSFHAGGGETYVWIDSRDTSNNIKNNIILYDDKTSTRTLTPFDTNTYSLGTSDLRWSNIYGILGNFKASVAGIITLQRTHTNGGAFIDYYNNNQTTNFWRVGMTADGDFGFAWKETLTNTCIKKNGYVGVLTTTVSYPLSVNGAAQVNLLIVSTANLYREVGGIILNNSDIWGLNAIYTLDLAEDAKEGYLFKRSDDYYDSLWCKDGVFYFSPKGNFTDGYKTNSTVLHSGNYTNYTVKKDGTGATGTWGINISGYAEYARGLSVKGFSASTDITWTHHMWTSTGSCSDVPSMSYSALFLVGYGAARRWQIWNSRNNHLLFWRPELSDMSDWAEVHTILDNVNSSVSGGGSSWGNSITVKINGVTKTLTIPSNPNTDYRVTQTVTTSDNTSWRPILIGLSYNDSEPFAPSTVTDSVFATHKVKIQPYTGTIQTYGNVILYSASGDSPMLYFLRGDINYTSAFDWRMYVSGGNFYLQHDYGAWTTGLLINYTGEAYIHGSSIVTKAYLKERSLGINGTDRVFCSPYDTHCGSIYAATSAGTSGLFLQSTGGTPGWVSISKSTVGLGNVQNTAFYQRKTSINGSDWDMAGTNSNKAFTIYAPETAGTSGYILKSNGSGAPTWLALSSLSVAWANVTGKPTIPTVGNGTVTIKLAGVSKGSFTMNQSGNTTIELTDNNTTYSLATSSTLGLVKIGYSTSNKNYAVQLDSSGKMYVNVPWTDTNTTYTLSSLGIGNVKNYDQSKAIKSITRSGTTFTYTCLDGTTGTFTQLDNNTTYSFAATGSATQGIYLAGTNTFKAMTYSLNATVNSGTTSKLAYYSGTNAISAHTSTVGSSVLPIYLKAGVPTACSVPMVRYWATYSVVFSSTNKITKIAGNHDFFNYNSTVVPGLATGMGHTANFPSGYNIDNTIISIIRVSKASTNSESYFTIPVVYVSGDSLIVQSNNKGSFQLSFICIG